jgi:hypothetical protein
MTTKMRGSFGGEKKFAHNSNAGGSTSGTEIARYSYVMRMQTCVPFPPKIVEKTHRCARTHLAFHEIWDTIITPQRCETFPQFIAMIKWYPVLSEHSGIISLQQRFFHRGEQLVRDENRVPIFGGNI